MNIVQKTDLIEAVKYEKKSYGEVFRFLSNKESVKFSFDKSDKESTPDLIIYSTDEIYCLIFSDGDYLASRNGKDVYKITEGQFQLEGYKHVKDKS